MLGGEIERSKNSAQPLLPVDQLGKQTEGDVHESRIRNQATQLIQRYSHQNKDGSNSGREEEKEDAKADPYYGADEDHLSDKSSVKTYSNQFSLRDTYNQRDSYNRLNLYVAGQSDWGEDRNVLPFRNSHEASGFLSNSNTAGVGIGTA